MLHNGNPSHYRLGVPEEFRPILQTFTAQQVHDAFPSLHVFDNSMAREYLAVAMFLRRYPGYDFVWMTEYDARYIGLSWGHYLNSALNIAVATLAGTAVDPADVLLRNLPLSTAKLPDILVFSTATHGAGTVTESFKPRDIDKWDFKTMIPIGAVLLGFSKSFYSLLIHHSLQGYGGYLEEYLATLAFEEGLDGVFVSAGTWAGTNPIHCCDLTAVQYYDEFYLRDGCQAYALLHPVKNANISIWGLPP